MMRRALFVSITLGMLAAPRRAAQDGGDDPLAGRAPAGATLDPTVDDATRARAIPIRVYLPAAAGAGDWRRAPRAWKMVHPLNRAC